MDIKLDRDTHDLVVEGYDLTLNTNLELERQRLKQSLLFFFGEWFLNTTEGVPYYQDVHIKAPDQVTLESVFKTKILETPGVNKLEKFQLEYDNIERALSLVFEVDTDFGTLLFEETF